MAIDPYTSPSSEGEVGERRGRVGVPWGATI